MIPICNSFSEPLRNRMKQFPFLSYKESKSITLYKPFEISTSIIGAKEQHIHIPSIESSSTFGSCELVIFIVDDIIDELNLGCSSLSSQAKYVISESMLSSGSFSHIWMARMLRSQQLYILKRIRIVILIHLCNKKERGIESIFSARREIFLGTLLRGKKGIAKYEECFIQDLGLIMNSTPTLPDRIISIPWLAFHYEGVSLSQMIYSQSASDKGYGEEGTSLSKKNDFTSFYQEQREPPRHREGMIMYPSVGTRLEDHL